MLALIPSIAEEWDATSAVGVWHKFVVRWRMALEPKGTFLYLRCPCISVSRLFSEKEGPWQTSLARWRISASVPWPDHQGNGVNTVGLCRCKFD